MSINQTAVRIGAQHVYFNLVLNNKVLPGTYNYIPLNYAETINTPFISKASDWQFAITRFSVPSDNIPLLTYTNTTYELAIAESSAAQPAFPPYDINPALLTFFPAFVQIANDAGEIYSYQDFVDAVNSALDVAWTAAKAAFPANPSTVPPMISFSAATGLFTLTAQTGAFWPDDNAAGTFIITMSPALMLLFDGLQHTEFTAPAPLNTYNPWSALTVQNQVTNSVAYPVGAAANTGWAMAASYKTLANWAELVSIAFTSDQLRFQPEYIPAPLYENDEGELVGNSNGASAFRPIITDYIAEDFNNVGYNETYLVFNSVGPYRWCSMLGNDPVQSIGVQGWWVDDSNNFNPILITPGSTASIKFLFRRVEGGNA